MLLKEFCTLDAARCTRDTTVLEAARLMRQKHIGDLIVVDDPNDECTPVGLITDPDLVVKVIGNELSAIGMKENRPFASPIHVVLEEKQLDLQLLALANTLSR